MTCPQCGGIGKVPHWGSLPDALPCPECAGGEGMPATADDGAGLRRTVVAERFGRLDELEAERGAA